jgi:hypothetical protein
VNTKKEIIKKIQNILNKSITIPRTLSPEEFIFVFSVLKQHPYFKQKEKCGIESIFIKKTVFKKNGFFVKRIDGTTTDFSYLKCLNGDNHKQEALAMFRKAIRQQIVDFRNIAFSNNSCLICPITNQIITKESCHIDHLNPTFNEMVTTFIKENNININDLEVGGKNQDNSMEYYFLDKKIECQWKTYHKNNAILRVTSIEGNLRRKKNEY